MAPELLKLKVIKTRWFSKWATKNKVDDHSLLIAAREVYAGLYEANYGGGVIKKRIANKNRGKSGSVRTLVAFKKGSHCFFMYGFEKVQKIALIHLEEKALKILAKEMFSYTGIQLRDFFKQGSLIEVRDE